MGKLFDNADVKADVKAPAKEAKAPAKEEKKEFKTPEAKRRHNVIEMGKLLKAELDAKKVTLSDEAQKALTLLIAGGLEGSGGAPRGGFLEKIFPELKVGAFVSAGDVFLKHKKGPYEMNTYIKQWATKGIIVAMNDKKGGYEITSLSPVGDK